MTTRDRAQSLAIMVIALMLVVLFVAWVLGE